MRNIEYIPNVLNLYEEGLDYPGGPLYGTLIQNLLKRLLPPSLFLSPEEGLNSYFQKMLPLVKWSEFNSIPFTLSILLLCKYRPNVGKFFHDMITRWLIPGRKLNVECFFSSNFKPSMGAYEEAYTVAEIVIKLDRNEDYEAILKGMQLVESEIKLGTTSVYHAERILETKGLSPDEKTGLIQEHIAYLIHKKPQDLDYDLFHQMQHFLVMCSAEFKAIRSYRHMSRIISIFYVQRRAIRQHVEVFPERRYVKIKLTKTKLNLPLGTKKVLSIFVGLNFLNPNELLEESHLLKTLEKYISGVKAVEGSWFVDDFRGDNIRMLYLEVEKKEEEAFTFTEIQKLRQFLPQELRDRVEQLQRPIFMPRNEEEVIRNIVTLAGEIRFVNDIPQAIITYDEQKGTDLFFTVILARVLKEESLSIDTLFKKKKASFHYIPDRVKKVGLIRGRYPKEITVFRIKIDNRTFLRGDHSVDLYLARQHIFHELEGFVGEIRDYNGGMISRQLEVFVNLKGLLGDIAKQHEFLLENFFHSLQPVELRGALEPQILKKLFLMLHSKLELAGFGDKKSDLMIERDPQILFVLLAVSEMIAAQRIEECILHLQIPSTSLISLRIQIFDTIFFGFIYYPNDLEKERAFIEALKIFKS